jgi:hypothetical protein
MFLMQTLERDRLAEFCDAYEAKVDSGTDPHAVPPHVLVSAALVEGGLRRQQAGMLTQLLALSWREAQNTVRDRGELAARFGVSIMLNLLFGVLFLAIGDVFRSDYDIQSHFGALFMIGVSATMGAAQV